MLLQRVAEWPQRHANRFGIGPTGDEQSSPRRPPPSHPPRGAIARTASGHDLDRHPSAHRRGEPEILKNPPRQSHVPQASSAEPRRPPESRREHGVRGARIRATCPRSEIPSRCHAPLGRDIELLARNLRRRRPPARSALVDAWSRAKRASANPSRRCAASSRGSADPRTVGGGRKRGDARGARGPPKGRPPPGERRDGELRGTRFAGARPPASPPVGACGSEEARGIGPASSASADGLSGGAVIGSGLCGKFRHEQRSRRPAPRIRPKNLADLSLPSRAVAAPAWARASSFKSRLLRLVEQPSLSAETKGSLSSFQPRTCRAAPLAISLGRAALQHLGCTRESRRFQGCRFEIRDPLLGRSQNQKPRFLRPLFLLITRPQPNLRRPP